jgi:putative flippase GtrA
MAGGTAALVNFGSRIIYNFWFGFSEAVILAYITGMIVAFFLSKLFVFKKGEHSIYVSGFVFVLVNIVAALQTWALSLGLAYYLLPFLHVKNFVPEIAHACGVAFPVFTSYIGHKYLSFR